MEIGAILLLVGAALALGWGLGFSSRQRRIQDRNATRDTTAVKHRLQLLFDNYSDDSLDRFVHSLDVNPETLSLHISIGKHFRTEGEVEKAIFIHQNLMSHPELPKIQSEPVVYELAKDYKAAGLFDRAEALLKQLIDSKAFGDKSKKLLLDVLELEKDWDQAVEMGLQIDFRRYPEVRTRVAQYCCEMAEQAQNSGNYIEARRNLGRALSTDKSCARAHLNLAALYIEQERYRDAIQQLKLLISLAPEYFTLAQPLLLQSTELTGSFAQYREYLMQVYRETGQVNVMLAVFDSYMAEGLEAEACDYLEKQTIEKPSLPALEALLGSRGSSVDGQGDRVWSSLVDVIRKIQQERPNFCCTNCGFAGQQLHWMCPSCKGWETVKPFIEYDTGH
jgi:lipopolysaccharide biosynthesis regulator YciM